MEAWLDYLDGCWKSGYSAYEKNSKKCPSTFMGANTKTDNAQCIAAWHEGYEKARREYEDDPPED